MQLFSEGVAYRRWLTCAHLFPGSLQAEPQVGWGAQENGPKAKVSSTNLSIASALVCMWISLILFSWLLKVGSSGHLACVPWGLWYPDLAWFCPTHSMGV